MFQKFNLEHAQLKILICKRQFNLNEILSLKFAQLTTCDVERSFSLYKNILTDLPTNLFIMENIEMYLVVHYCADRRDNYDDDCDEEE
jgi:hypothetical protein